jgi:asparagine synthase (glutamine-hydrolysing)
MVPAHYVVEIQLVGCPDPDPVHTRFFNPQRNKLTDLDEIGREYIGALANEVTKWLKRLDQTEPIGVCFFGASIVARCSSRPTMPCANSA